MPVGVMIPLCSGSKFGSGIVERLKIRLRIEIQSRNHNTSSCCLSPCFQLFSSSSESEDDDYFAIHDVSSSSQRVVTGEPATFSLPVYLRRDGLALRVGQVIAHNGGRFAVRNILVTSGKEEYTVGRPLSLDIL